MAHVGSNADIARDQNISYLHGVLNPTSLDGHYVQPCMEGTRKEIFQEIQEWLDNINSEKNIMWIKGSPGAGKSAIAFTLDSRLRENGRSGGFFAFRRGVDALSDPATVWRTMAYDLAQSDNAIASAVTETIKNRRVNLQQPNIAQHFQALIARPLTHAQHQFDQLGYPVFIIDALDECGNLDRPDPRRALLDTLVLWSDLPKTYKLIFTGRDEHVPKKLRDACHMIVLPTGNEVDDEASADITTFLKQRFEVAREGLESLGPDWPGPIVVQELAARAAGLFIWAVTVMRFIERKQKGTLKNLKERLQYVRGNGVLDQTGMNELYGQIVLRAADNIDDRLVQPLLGAIVFAKAPLSINHLTACVVESGVESVEVLDIEEILEELGTVISVGTDGLVRIDHLSFMDFLLSSICLAPFRISGNDRGSHNLVLLCTCLATAER